MLGCPEWQIRRRFDSIVDFSGVERFLDTPVKHYSSGMYMRLAYAVAAHVDADILIIDEVLAVGDEEFRKKCLSHVALALSQGKSAIIVSHNLSVVKSLASHVAWLQEGRLHQFGPVDSEILLRYAA